MLTPTGFAPLRDHSIPLAIDEMVARAKALYTLPAVAAEVIQLTSNPAVEPQTLKECILRDPALTAKILRVVNSSLFGLPGEVCDLNQAIALLGIKPLKILVLGFSLPDALFAGVARDQLQWYWTTTLTRAVAAREISEQLFKTPGDEAFLAGLLQSLGVLVLAKQLGPSYAVMLGRSIDSGIALRHLEQEALGFDHLALTLALLKEWNMPRQLTEAIACQQDPLTLAREHRHQESLVKVLHLANLTTDLVGQHHLSVLPDLLEAGEIYCGLDKARLHDLILSLQPKVNHLADVLSLEVGGGFDYAHILTAAHDLMSELAESAFAPAHRNAALEAETSESLMQDAVELRAAMDRFLRKPKQTDETRQTPLRDASLVHRDSEKEVGELVEWITLIAANCRSRREPLSLLMLKITDQDLAIDATGGRLSDLFDTACHEELPSNAHIEKDGTWRRTVVLPACDRQEAVNLAHQVLRRLDQTRKSLATAGQYLHGNISAGIASVTLPSRSFRPADLLNTAERCLAAALDSETSVVKSLEIY